MTGWMLNWGMSIPMAHWLNGSSIRSGCAVRSGPARESLRDVEARQSHRNVRRQAAEEAGAGVMRVLMLCVFLAGCAAPVSRPMPEGGIVSDAPGWKEMCDPKNPDWVRHRATLEAVCK